MGEWTFPERNPIVSYRVGVEFARALPAGTLRQLSARHAEFRRDLPRRVLQQALTLQLGGAPVPQPQADVGGVVFDFVQPDGTIGRALSVVQQVASYMVADYPRWVEFWPQAERLLRPAIELALAENIPVTALILAANNRFAWSSAEESPDFTRAMRSDSGLVARHMLDCDGAAHSLHGYYKSHDAPKGQRLDNIMISSAKSASGSWDLDVNFAFRLTLHEPVRDIGTLFTANDADDRPLLEQGLKSLHQLNNQLFRDIVAESLVNRIPGLPGRC